MTLGCTGAASMQDMGKVMGWLQAESKPVALTDVH